MLNDSRRFLRFSLFKRVQVKFTYENRTEVRYVDVYKWVSDYSSKALCSKLVNFFSRKVTDLKFRLEKLFGLPASKMRLYYVDQSYGDMTAPEEMKYPNKQLYSYNISTGDEIIVEPKTLHRLNSNSSHETNFSNSMWFLCVFPFSNLKDF